MQNAHGETSFGLGDSQEDIRAPRGCASLANDEDIGGPGRSDSSPAAGPRGTGAPLHGESLAFDRHETEARGFLAHSPSW
jgi:hypothetical protein